VTLRASDPCRLLVLSRNTAAATEHAPSRPAPTSLSCLAKGREGHAAWVCNRSERSLSSLGVAWILHAIFTRGRGESERRCQPGQSCAVCLKILRRSFAAFWPRLKLMPFKEATIGSRPSDDAKINRPGARLDRSAESETKDENRSRTDKQS